EIARDQLNRLGQYQVVAGVLSPVHDNYGKSELISATHRCSQLKLALHDSDWLHLSDWECSQEEWTRTCEVLQYHQNCLNSALNCNENSGLNNKTNSLLNCDEPLWVKQALKYSSGGGAMRVKILCGADLLESFGTPGLWHDNDIETIVRDHGLVVITRPGSNPYKFIYESDILTKYQNQITIVTEWIWNEVSSTKIRRSLRRGESVKYLVPTPVIDYIKSNGLYGTYDNKYGYNSSSVYLTPSPNDVVMTRIVSSNEDSPDSGNYSTHSVISNELLQTPPLLYRSGGGTNCDKKQMGGGGGAHPGQAVREIAISPRKVNCLKDPEGTVEVDGEEICRQFQEEGEEEVGVGGDETRVEIQITEDGHIEVISDKETTV
ncbi:hypothetical protein AAG570_009642, partial [Ranatra chinensis]